jgi:hypothetical protein
MSGISPLQKKDPKKKGEEQGLKSKRGETSSEKLHVSKKRKKWMRSPSCWERFYQKKERKEITFSYSENLMCGLIHTHTSFAFALPSIP